jgi:hypothetical protein
MIKQIMIDEVTDNVVNLRDDITIKITQIFPMDVINKCRIVKSGNRQNLDNSQYVILETYRNVVMNLFINYQNYVRYRKHNNNYIINNF